MAQGAGRPRGGGGSAAKTAKSDQNGRVEANGVTQNMTDLEFLRGLIEAVDQSGIDSLEINRAGTRIRIAKTPAAAAVHTTSYPSMPAQIAPAPAVNALPAGAPASTGGGEAAKAPASADVSAADDGAAGAASNLVDVKSPMVGTFYRGPAPEAPPYVEIGTSVSKGQTLCILEAMKLMNEMECEHDGVIREILVEDADPVQYGQVMFRIQPS